MVVGSSVTLASGSSSATPQGGFPDLIQRWLLVERCIPLSIAEFFGLGWDGRGLTIPIEGWVKRYNITGYDPITGLVTHGDEGKMKWTVKGDGEIPPFPSINDMCQGDIIVEGELDAICAIAHGFVAISGTGGSGTWKAEWTDSILAHPYTILYDNDDAGRNGAIKVAQSLLAGGGYAKIAKWPTDRPVGFDITDHFRLGGSAEELQDILDSAEEYVSRGTVLKGRVLGGIEL